MITDHCVVIWSCSDEKFPFCLNHERRALERSATRERLSALESRNENLDHILINPRWNALSDCRVYPSAEFGNTDHRLLSVTLRLKMRALTRRPQKCLRRHDTERLKQLLVREQFRREVGPSSSSW